MGGDYGMNCSISFHKMSHFKNLISKNISFRKKNYYRKSHRALGVNLGHQIYRIRGKICEEKYTF